MGAITLAAREKLDNLIFVINCNLQRLDGPVRGNGKVIQELEGAFRGAGWNVIKVIWGSNWDPLLARDTDGALVRRMGEVVDGQYLKYTVMPGSYIREHFFGSDPQLLALVADMTDDQLRKLGRGGHDPAKVYAAYQAAVKHRAPPPSFWPRPSRDTAWARRVKGATSPTSRKSSTMKSWGSSASVSTSPSAKARWARPRSSSRPPTAPKCSTSMPAARPWAARAQPPLADRQTRSAQVGRLRRVFRGERRPRGLDHHGLRAAIGAAAARQNVGKYIVPIVPDEARTFGMEALFRQIGIYSHAGQLYEPVDSDTVLYYREATNGQILEEGITEAGSISSFIAAGTAHSSHGLNMIPFFIYYSMFGFQRIGDLLWAAGDMRCRGFVMGGTAGRTTLAGEGLQHQDGNSHHYALAYPNLQAYDPVTPTRCRSSCWTASGGCITKKKTSSTTSR